MRASAARVGAMIRKEARHILRDWQTLAIIVAMPIVMMFLYGYALTLDVRDAAIVVEEPTPSAASRHLTSSLDATTMFEVVAVVPAVSDIPGTLKRYGAKAIVKLPPDFDEDLHDGGTASRVQVLIDGADQNLGTILSNAIEPAVRGAALQIVGIEPPEPVEVRPRILYNPEQESALYFVPGLMAIILIMISALLTSLTLTREKEYGTMEQLLVSPIRPWDVIIGKIVPYIAIAGIDGALILVVGRLFFGVTIRGSALFLAASGVIYIVTSLALGLIFSTFARTQQQAMMMTLPATMMPTVILSGFIFPLRSMPVFLQAVSRIIPATYFLELIRGIVLKGVGPVALWQPLAGLVGLGALFLVISIVKFRTTL